MEEAGSTASWIETDVSDMASLEKMTSQVVAEYGRIDVLINNAAIVAGIQKPWTDITPEEWRRNIDVDLTGMFLAARAATPRWRAGGMGGS